jgi:DhnA family fructose-bisphosphate aldolase class Ia
MPNHEDEIIEEVIDLMTCALGNSVYTGQERDAMLAEFREKLGQLAQAAAYADQPTLNAMLTLINP